jgi:hypothetical protein
VRPRWQEWVITLAIVALFATGVWTLWGKDIRALFRPDEARPQPVAAPAGPATPPPGPAKGPC